MPRIAGSEETVRAPSEVGSSLWARFAWLVATLLALFWFNTLFTYTNLVPTPWIRLEPRLSLELVALVVFFALLGMNGRRLAWPIKGLLAVLLFTLASIRYVDITAPGGLAVGY